MSADPARPVGVGIVGAGAIVRARHAPGLRALPGVRIVAVANASEDSARAFCREWAPDAAVAGSWRELVARPGVDAVLVGAAPFLHEPASIAALAAGRHVFCQARMASDLAGARRMLAASDERPDLVAMLCPPPHGLRADAFVRQMLAEGTVGKVRSVRVRSLHGAFLNPAAAHWRQRSDISGKNILSLGIYTEVLQRWFGAFEPCAASGQVFVSERGGVPIRIPDALQVLGRFASGASLTMDLSGVFPGPALEAIEIAGERGLLVVDGASDRIELCRAGENRLVELGIPPQLDRPWRVEADFIEAVREPARPRPHPDFRDGVAYMEVVEKVWALLG